MKAFSGASTCKRPTSPHSVSIRKYGAPVDFTYFIIAPVLPKLIGGFMASGAGTSMGYGASQAVFAIAQFFSASVLGGLSDRYGRRPILLLPRPLDRLASIGALHLPHTNAQRMEPCTTASMAEDRVAGRWSHSPGAVST